MHRVSIIVGDSKIDMDQQATSKRTTVIALALICTLFVALSAYGITWGLPDRSVDRVLFGEGEPWSGEKIYRLANAAEKFDKTRGADVDANPLDKSQGDNGPHAPILITGSKEDIAKIYLRYRLYTYQPDEMITMMALAGMSPGAFDFDPRLYQYGGLFIYPVGALIKVCDLLGVIDVRSDVTFYLDHPGEFGKFYVVARAYAAAWGVLGIFTVFAIARRIAGSMAQPPGTSDGTGDGTGAGLLAALLFTLMPVVVCMTHEGKPHLPGAVLMLAAVLFAMRRVESRLHYDWLLMCGCCGAALGMVLSSWPIFALIPLVAWLSRGSVVEGSSSLWRTAIQAAAGLGIAGATYFITNPYVVINAIFHPGILQSNLGNSLGMYQIDRVGQGLLRVLELTIEGVTLPVLVLGVIAVVGAWRWCRMSAMPLGIAAGIFFIQFVSIGADKPGEYGRFGIFPNTAFVIAASCLLMRVFRQRRAAGWVAIVAVTAWMGFAGYGYLHNFRADAVNGGSRRAFHQQVIQQANAAEESTTAPWLGKKTHVGLIAEPAPYSCPPLPFDTTPVYLFANREAAIAAQQREPTRWTLLWTTDQAQPTPQRPMIATATDPQPVTPFRSGPITPVTPISWANKPIERHEASTPVAPK